MNNGIKQLNNEIKRLYNGLIRLDARVNRVKRGLNEQKSIVDCIQMKDKLKTIYDELNRIIETLSMMDENGICRCKCPLNITNIKVTHVADLPFELTTFGLENIDDAQSSSSPTEKTKQLKKILLSNYEPQNTVDNNMKSTIKITTDEDIFDKTTDEGNGFISTSTADTTTTSEENVITTETREDMFPAMSNTITNFVNFNNNNNTQTVKPQPFSTETPTSTTVEITDLNESTEITYLNYDVTTLQENLDTNFVLKLTTINENVSEFNTETSVFKLYDSNTKVTIKDLELTIANDNILGSTSEITESNKKYSTNYTTTETSLALTSENEYISEFTTEVTKKYYDNNTNVIDITLELTTENYNINELPSTTSILVSNTSNGKTNIEEKTSSENQDELKNEKNINQSMIDKPNVEQENKMNKLDSYDNKSTLGPNIIQVEPIWYPICFYTVPCTQNISNYQQSIQNTSKNTIQYSAQSLKTYKKKTPVADPTIIQNSYPILSYCPVGMICSKIDFAKEANVTTMLHCMLQPSYYKSINLEKNTVNTSYQAIQDNYEYNKTKNSNMVKSKSSRDSDEILTGNI